MYGWSVGARQETTKTKIGTQPSFFDDDTHSEVHLSLAQTMNESEKEKPVKE